MSPEVTAETLPVKRKRGGQPRHGFSRRGATTREYRSWIHMKSRCLDHASKYFAYYGGRGICIHPVWITSFSAFIRDVGLAPSPLHTLERIDVDGHYEPGNVRWATRTEQQRNRRDSRTLAVNGVTLSLYEWAEKYGRNINTILGRLRKGWTPERALATPPMHKGRGPASKMVLV